MCIYIYFWESNRFLYSFIFLIDAIDSRERRIEMDMNSKMKYLIFVIFQDIIVTHLIYRNILYMAKIG